jgi:2-polyprenyl-6-hydroxyphenyl methylase/3-demethylubiquinone-9 3-methyltransferase
LRIVRAADTAEQRFAFGENWWRFLSSVDAERIRAAEDSLRRLLGEGAVEGRTVLDVGAGSGLFSLAALRLGARRVHSIDADPDSVRCVEELKRRYAPHAESWTSDGRDVLDAGAMAALGTFEIVYAWGVLHHTGDMWRALENVCARVGSTGVLAVSIYNDQGRRSATWRSVKRTYNRMPPPLRRPFAAAVIAPGETARALRSVLAGDARAYARLWRRAGPRGMSRWADIVDWVGGYPFEVARPEEVLRFCRARGFVLENLKTVGGAAGCNEFVFRRSG